LLNALADQQFTLVPSLVEGADVPESADLPPLCGRYSTLGMLAASPKIGGRITPVASSQKLKKPRV